MIGLAALNVIIAHKNESTHLEFPMLDRVFYVAW